MCVCVCVCVCVRVGKSVVWFSPISERKVKPYRKNWALKKPAINSVLSKNHPASLAVNGDRSNDYNHGSCSQTIVCQDPWWQVDLLEYVLVDTVFIVNRGDCCGMYAIELLSPYCKKQTAVFVSTTRFRTLRAQSWMFCFNCVIHLSVVYYIVNVLLCYIALHYIALHCITLHCIVLHCIAL